MTAYYRDRGDEIPCCGSHGVVKEMVFEGRCGGLNTRGSREGILLQVNTRTGMSVMSQIETKLE